MENICHHKVTDTLIKREADRQQEVLKRKNEKKLSNAEHEQYSYFNKIFDEKQKNINTILDQALVGKMSKSELVLQFDKVSKELNYLQKFMADSTLFLRGYDIRVCQATLQDMELRMRKIEDLLIPKKRFGFKNKKPVKDNPTKHDHDEVDNVIKKCVDFEEFFFGFKNKNNETMSLEYGTLFKKDVTLKNLTNCTIILPGTPSTLQISNLKNCLVLCGPVCTSVFADNCVDCKLVLACQQLRLHNSSTLDIYLHVTSKAIIEDCKGIKVAPYNYSYSSVMEDFGKAGLDIEINHWNSLDDFNWLVADKSSPNWTILDESARVSNWSTYKNST